MFCPRLRIRRLTRSGSKWFHEALFPGYLFARFDPTPSQRQVAFSPGVTTIIRFSDDLAKIPDHVIEELRAEMGASETKVFAEPLCEGEKVIVGHGLFRGLSSVVTRVIPAADRVRILLEFLGQCREVEVAYADVIPDRGRFLSA